MSQVDSLYLPNMSNGSSHLKYLDFPNYHHQQQQPQQQQQQQQQQMLISPSTSSTIPKNSVSTPFSYSGNSVPGEEISTIFVVGFPENMQEREFQNMFIFSPGFEAATLKLPLSLSNNSNTRHDNASTEEDNNNRKQIIGFAKFRTRGEALEAKEVLNGKKIDSDKVLKAEMAKKNLHTRRGLSNEPASTTSKSLYEAFYSVPIEEFSPSTSPTHSYIQQHNNSLFGMMGNQFTTNQSIAMNNNSHYHHHHHQQQQQHSSSSLLASLSPPLQKEDILASHLLQKLVLSSTVSSPMPTLSISTNNVDQNPPCNTLYVGNLPANTNEEELRQLFTHCIGYKRCSYRVKSNGPMCFVEFDDVQYATLALKEMQGIPLSNSVKGGIRLSYSKNPLGVRQSNVVQI